MPSIVCLDDVWRAIPASEHRLIWASIVRYRAVERIEFPVHRCVDNAWMDMWKSANNALVRND